MSMEKQSLKFEKVHIRSLLFCVVSYWCPFCTKHFTFLQRSCRKVMFSVVSVHQLFRPQQGPYVTITHDVLNLIVTAPPPLPAPAVTGHQTWDPLALARPRGHHTCDSPASEIWWSSLENCSNLLMRESLSPGATSGGGHWSTYGLQACGKHSSGMLSCSENYRHQWSENSHLEAIIWVQS